MVQLADVFVHLLNDLDRLALVRLTETVFISREVSHDFLLVLFGL